MQFIYVKKDFGTNVKKDMATRVYHPELITAYNKRPATCMHDVGARRQEINWQWYRIFAILTTPHTTEEFQGFVLLTNDTRHILPVPVLRKCPTRCRISISPTIHPNPSTRTHNFKHKTTRGPRKKHRM